MTRDLGRLTLIIHRKYCISVKKFYNQHKSLRVHTSAGLWRATIGINPHRMKQRYTSKGIDISKPYPAVLAHAEIPTDIWRNSTGTNILGHNREASNMLNNGHFFGLCLPGHQYNQVFICGRVFVLL